jgi:hypothetical protein
MTDISFARIEIVEGREVVLAAAQRSSMMELAWAARQITSKQNI